MNQEVINTKKCNICDQIKPVNNFYFRKENNESRNECILCHLKKKKIYTKKTKQHKHQYNKKYYSLNKEKFIQYTKKKRKTDINWYLRTRFSNYVNKQLKLSNIKKQTTNIDLLGCTVFHFKKHLESLFESGMTWENHGFGDGKWHIDHIIPCSFFNLVDYTERKICFHYTNQRPMWHKDNLMKNNSIYELNLVNN